MLSPSQKIHLTLDHIGFVLPPLTNNYEHDAITIRNNKLGHSLQQVPATANTANSDLKMRPTGFESQGK